MKRNFFLIAAIAVAALLLVCAAFFLPKAKNAATTPTTAAPTPTSPSTEISQQEELSVSLGHGLFLTEVSSYTGPFVEDGSDEIVAGVLAIKVANRGENAIEYCQIALPVTEGTASFSLSGLMPGQTALLLEQNRLPWRSSEQYDHPLVSNTAYYNRPLSLHREQLSLQLLDGGINVTNISGTPIVGDIVIYYKNKQQDLFYGGITYRLRISSGLNADATCQLLSQHLHKDSTEILFITVG